MGLLDRLLPNDRQLAATKYADRESASARNARLDRERREARLIQASDGTGTPPGRRRSRRT